MRSEIRNIALIVCSVAICSACYCAEKTDTGASQSDTGASQPSVRQVQPTEYDEVISEIKDKLTKDQRNALEATHYCLEIVELIKDNGDIDPGRKLDKLELERQFRKIALEDYNYSNFQVETVQFLKDTIETIKNLRISEGDRRLLDERYVQEKRSAWMRILPQNMAVLLSGDWKQIVAASVQTLIYSTFNYLKIRSEIEDRYGKERWEIDKEVLKNDTVDVQRNLDNLFRICNNYNVTYVSQGDIRVLLKRFNKVEALINSGVTDDVLWKPIHDCRDYFRDYANRYKLLSTYWYLRGYLAWFAYRINKIEEDRKEAIGCFKVYQELTKNQIVKYNTVAIDVAMMQIGLHLVEEETNRGFLLEQLVIIDDNLRQEALEYQSVCFFCGQIFYLALKDYDKAAKMFMKSEVAGNTMRTQEIDEFCKNLEDKTEEIEGSDKAAIGDFAVKDKDDDSNQHYLPKLDAEFLARMAYYKSLIEDGKDIDADNMNLVYEIYKEASWPYISPWEFLFYAAYVKEASTKKEYYEKILPKVLLDRDENFDCNEYFSSYSEWESKPVGMRDLPYGLKYLSYTPKSWPRKDRFILKMPYQYAMLSNIGISMGLLRDEEVVTTIPCDSKTMEKDKENNISLCLEFLLDETDLKNKKIDGIRFDFEYHLLVGANSHKCFKSAITFKFGGVLTERMGNDYYKNLPGYISFELMDLGDLEKGLTSNIGTGK